MNIILCVNCDEHPARWHPRDYFVDNAQFCTQRCAAVWGHRMAEADDLANEYTKDRALHPKEGTP